MLGIPYYILIPVGIFVMLAMYPYASQGFVRLKSDLFSLMKNNRTK